MPFWKKDKKAAAVQENGSASNGTTTSNGSNSSGENGVGSSSNGGGAWVKDPKVNYKARLEHKQYLVSGLGIWSVQDFLDNIEMTFFGLDSRKNVGLTEILFRTGFYLDCCVGTSSSVF